MSKRINMKEPTTIENIPQALITEIFARVGGASLTDLFNLKLSCKKFSELGEDKLVYQRVLLDKLPIVSWLPLNETQRAFFKRCKECKNPEMLYRKAVLDYFNKVKKESAWMRLEEAVELGHIGALYLKGILLLLNGDDKSIDLGVHLLGCMTKSTHWRTQFRNCRNDLKEILNGIWVHYKCPEQRPRCCQIQTGHGTRYGWDGEITTQCEACNADSELKFIYDSLP